MFRTPTCEKLYESANRDRGDERTVVMLEDICTPEIGIINLIWPIFTRSIEMVPRTLEIDTCIGVIPVWAE